MAKRRADGPYLWVTWLTRLLVGESACEWAAWFRAQHEGGSWARAPSAFDQVSWQMAHTAAINESPIPLQKKELSNSASTYQGQNPRKNPR